MKYSLSLIGNLKELLPNDFDVEAANKQTVNADGSPWYIKLFMGFCGWLSALFVLSFFGLGLFQIWGNEFALYATGVTFLGLAYFVLKQSESEFITHLGLAISFTGQFFITAGIFETAGNISTEVWAAITFMHCLLACVMPSYLHRVMSAYFATITLALCLAEMGLASFYSGILLFVVALMWLNEYTFSSRVKHIQAIAYGASFGLLQFKTSILFIGAGTWEYEALAGIHPWLDEGLNLSVLYYIVFILIKKRGLPTLEKNHSSTSLQLIQTKILSLFVFLLISFATFFANGIALGLSIILLGYSAQNKALFVMGIIACVVNLSSYYYLLETSLLNKSFILCTLGIFSLLLAYAYKRINLNVKIADE